MAFLVLLNPPPSGDQDLSRACMLQLLLDLANQLFPLRVNGILGVEKFTPLCITATFEFPQLLLVG
jgi:hypothetical protein